MRLEKWRTHKKVISTIVVSVVLILSVPIFPVSAEDGCNDALRIYEALTSIDASTTEYVYIPCEGESMYPTIRDGDSVKVLFYTNGSSIDVGDIIIFHSWTVGVCTGAMWIGHRVIKRYKEGDIWYFKTKGDNCPEPDSWEVPESAILGEVVGIEHTESSQAPPKLPSRPERSHKTYPNAELPQGSEIFLLIIGIFCLGAILEVFKHLGRKRQISISNKPDYYLWHGRTYYTPPKYNFNSGRRQAYERE
jgi:signal peptidase I